MDIISTIRKLIERELGERAIGNYDAADAYAGKVHSLLTKYNLSRSDIQEPEEQEFGEAIVESEAYDLPSRNSRVEWTECLAKGVAEGHYCKVLVFPDSNSVVFVGQKRDREIAALMLVILSRAALKASKTEYAEFCKRADSNPILWLEEWNYERSFLIGFAIRIKHRYEQMLNQTACQALIRITKPAVDAYVSDRWPNKAGDPKVGFINRIGLVAGATRADLESLTDNGIAGHNGKFLSTSE